MTRLLALFAIATVLATTGCDDLCTQGIQLEAKLANLQTEVGGTLLTPNLINQNCQDFRVNWVGYLTTSSRYAALVAQKVFSNTSSSCLRSHYERQCVWQKNPYNPQGGEYVCKRTYVCDQYGTRPVQRDGYDEAIELSELLSTQAATLSAACDEHDAGSDALALVKFAEVKTDAADAASDTDYVLTKAGCYDRTGD